MDGNQLRISYQISHARTLVSYLYLSWNPHKALLIDANDRQDEVTCFSRDENAEVYRSCDLTWHNNFYVFGGYSNVRQISQVIGKKLTVIGSLGFDFYHGACDVMGIDKIWLCFGYDANDYKRCRVGLNPLETFTQVQQTTFEHRGAKVAASDCKSQ